MLLEFKKEDTQSYDEGMGKPFLKANQPFEVEDGHGRELLKTKFFKKAEPKQSVLPEDFPARDILEKNKIYTFEQVSALGNDALMAINGIGVGFTEQILNRVVKMKAEAEKENK